jgi:hypothetical protein
MLRSWTATWCADKCTRRNNETHLLHFAVCLGVVCFLVFLRLSTKANPVERKGGVWLVQIYRPIVDGVTYCQQLRQSASSFAWMREHTRIRESMLLHRPCKLHKQYIADSNTLSSRCPVDVHVHGDQKVTFATDINARVV